MVRSLGLLLALASLSACRDPAPPPAPGAPAPVAATTTPQRPDQLIGGNVIPQAHEVPAGRAGEIRRLFESGTMSYPIAVVSAQGAQTQFVQPKPVFVGDNRFVVGAPPHVHTAIDAMLKSLGTAPAAESHTYELSYWILEAIVAPKFEAPADITEIAPMLEKLPLGTRRFKVIDHVSGRMRDGASAVLQGRFAQIHEKLIAVPDGLDLELGLELRGVWSDNKDKGPMVQTTLQLKLDKPIVLGDSTLPGASDGQANLLLYVVRARRVD